MTEYVSEAESGRTERPLRETLSWTILIFILVLPCLVNSLGSVVAVAAALILAVSVLWHRGALLEVRRQPAMLVFLVAFSVLALTFLATAGAPADMRFVLNFLALPLTPAVYLVARERPLNDTSLVFVLALIGVAAGAILAIAGVTVLGISRAQGLFGGPNLMPRIAIPLGFIAMAGALIVSGPLRRVFYLGPVFAIVIAMLAASRGGALALAPLALIAAGTLALRRDTRRDLLGVGALTILAIAAVWVFWPSESARLLSTASSLSDALGGSLSQDFATAERQAMLAAGWTAFLDAPLIGYGWANLGTAAALADPAGFGHQAKQVFLFHNDFFDFAIAGGVAGIAVYLLLLVAPVAGALAAARDGLKPMRIYGALVLSVSFAVFGFTDMTFGYDVTMTLYAFLTALILGIRAPARR